MIDQNGSCFGPNLKLKIVSFAMEKSPSLSCNLSSLQMPFSKANPPLPVTTSIKTSLLSRSSPSPMAERVPTHPTVPDSPVDDDPSAASHTQDRPIFPGKTQSDDLLLSSGTYIVQVPKDQIYRVPPPENAVIADRHRNNGQKTNASSPCCYRCFSVAIFLIVVVVVIASGVVAAGLYFGFFSPENPDFSVRRVIIEKQKNSRLNYDLELQAKNSNAKLGISYKAGGSVSLQFKSKKVAEGKYPTFDQSQKNSTKLEVFLRGSNVVLPKEMQKSLKGKIHLSFTLKINVSVETRIWVFKKGQDLEVTCNFMVDSLATGTRILSQKCITEKEN